MNPEPSSGKASVLIVEDHPMFRERLCELINREHDLEVRGEVDNIQDALRLLQSGQHWEIVLLDITLRSGSGLELLKQVKAAGIDVSVLVLSMHDESLYAERSLRAGARGYITKYESSPEVMSAIRRVLAGDVYLGRKVTSKILNGLARPVAPQQGTAQLTDRELEIFQLLGEGRTTREISLRLHVAMTTVDTYRARLKTKLGLTNGSQLLHEAVRWVESGSSLNF